MHHCSKALIDLEVIVVDAGSMDQIFAIDKQHGCKVFVGNPGRAQQMNAGATIAAGEHLLFLHADTRLPEGDPANDPRQSIVRDRLSTWILRQDPREALSRAPRLTDHRFVKSFSVL